MKLTIRPIDESEIQTFRSKLSRGFGGDLHKDDDPNRLFRVLDVQRTVCAFDGASSAVALPDEHRSVPQDALLECTGG